MLDSIHCMGTAIDSTYNRFRDTSVSHHIMPSLLYVSGRDQIKTPTMRQHTASQTTVRYQKYHTRKRKGLTRKLNKCESLLLLSYVGLPILVGLIMTIINFTPMLPSFTRLVITVDMVQVSHTMA